MKSALDIAHYFLRRVDREAGDTISPLKLQKLIYYAQAWSLALRDKPLFHQEIEAWVSGPVVRDVWDKYQAYKYRDIPPPEELEVELTAEEIEVLEEVWDVYGELSAKRLQELTKSETPWFNASESLKSAGKNIISHDDMKSYYADFVDV